jgi:alpha,alpha-trehalose phosphorylase
MTADATFVMEPWRLREIGLDLDRLAHSESVFALANGHLGLRGNLDEGEPFGAPGTYLNSVFERRPLPYAEAGYGYPESGQTVINVTNGKLIRLLVDDEPFDVRYGTLRSHERCLDLQAGTLTRAVDWVSPAGQGVRVRATRLVSFTQRAVAAIEYEVEAVDHEARVVVQSELVANEAEPPADTSDPRVAAALESPLRSELNEVDGSAAVLVHRTEESGLHVAAAMGHLVEGPERLDRHVGTDPDTARFTVTTRLAPGERLRIVKFLGYGWSSIRSKHALRDQVTAAVTAARHTSWEGLLAEQRAFLDDYWSSADVEVVGDPEVEHAVRFAMYHVLQAGARAEDRPIAAKGLTGNGYDGHSFWDTEIFVLPVLVLTAPEAAASALRWRHSILPDARGRAATLGLRGAAFPWRTIDGAECSGYWPAGTAAFHINAAVADAVLRYLDATEDEAFDREIGVELLVETARLWRSLGHHDADDEFRIDGVTGPDEYSAVADNNVYTNLMAQRNLRGAVDAVARHPDVAAALGIDDAESGAWAHAAERMRVPYDERLEVHPQADAFTDHEEWDFEATPPQDYPLMSAYPYVDLYRKQVVKQADLVLAMQLCPDAFTEAEMSRNFEYYEARTVRDSSLSAGTQAVMAAATGHVELAYDYLADAALTDLQDRHANTANGLHLAAIAASWTAVVAGLGGLRAGAGRLRFAPRLPEDLSRVRINLRYRSRRLRVTIDTDTATYELVGGDPLEIEHFGSSLRLADEPVTEAIPALAPRPRPTQPAGRAPAVRDGRADDVNSPR